MRDKGGIAAYPEKVTAMWKELWQRWTIDNPAAFGDLLWDVFVVQFAAFLDRFTIRKVIALVVPIVLLAIAYHHGIALPPELVLAGDFLAYIDIFTVVLLVGMLSCATTVLFVIKKAAARSAQFANGLVAVTRRLDVRHRRTHGAKGRKRLTGQPKNDDDGRIVVGGLAWA
jgi:hypothetical protein